MRCKTCQNKQKKAQQSHCCNWLLALPALPDGRWTGLRALGLLDAPELWQEGFKPVPVCHRADGSHTCCFWCSCQIYRYWIYLLSFTKYQVVKSTSEEKSQGWFDIINFKVKIVHIFWKENGKHLMTFFSFCPNQNYFTTPLHVLPLYTCTTFATYTKKKKFIWSNVCISTIYDL